MSLFSSVLPTVVTVFDLTGHVKGEKQGSPRQQAGVLSRQQPRQDGSTLSDASSWSSRPPVFTQQDRHIRAFIPALALPCKFGMQPQATTVSTFPR